ncbi:MAG: alkaline phosphatase family protein [Ruminococcus sp.]|nr:alkaline phosphatase family protein [Ruminococcus sp.]
MIVRNNYNECITNLACSIRKYFDLDYKHNTLSYIDELLSKKQPKNVVVLLFDGMGSRILDRTLDNNDFFIKNKVKEITTVFPATTTAATNSIMSGLNPVEHGYLGWYSYVKPLDEVIMLFFGINKETQEISEKYAEVREEYFVNKTITDEINEKGKYKSRILFPFGENKYDDLDDMLSIIKKECKSDGKKYIYAYDDEPDHTMHDLGPDNEDVKKLIKIRNDKLEELCKELDDTIVFVIADHGHIKVDNMFLKDYPDIIDMLERTTSIEQRAVSFKIKDRMHEKFEKRFNELFGKYFNLYNKADIIESKLFGDGEENSLFRSAIGDYIAIAETSNKALLMDGDEVLFSQHAGYTDDEIYIPLIIIDKTKDE